MSVDILENNSALRLAFNDLSRLRNSFALEWEFNGSYL